MARKPDEAQDTLRRRQETSREQGRVQKHLRARRAWGIIWMCPEARREQEIMRKRPQERLVREII